LGIHCFYLHNRNILASQSANLTARANPTELVIAGIAEISLEKLLATASLSFYPTFGELIDGKQKIS